MVWVTGVGKFGRVSSESIGAIVAAEYRLLREHPMALLLTIGIAGTDHDLSYYVMEYLAGPTLRAVLTSGTAAARIDLLAPFAQLVAALRSAQGSGTAFIHGDLKPENIIVTADHWRIIDPAPRGDVGEVSRVATRAYNPTIDCSVQSDLRALAIILFEILAGWQPFMHLSPHWLYPVLPGDPFREVWACLETEQCTRAAKEPHFQQLLAWMREPPSYAALVAFLRERLPPTATVPAPHMQAPDTPPPLAMPPLREPPPGIPQPSDSPDTHGSLMLDRYRLMSHLPMTGYTEADIHTDVARDTRLNRLVLLRWLDTETVFERVRAYRTESGLPLPIDHVEDYFAVLPAEAEGAARVGVHPDILTLFDYVPGDGGVQCLVLEYPPGGRLTERLHRAPLPLVPALHLTATVARTLDDAHTRGLNHWHLNPENIFLTETGRPKVHGFTRGAANTFVVRELGALLASILNGRSSPSAWRSATHDAPSILPREPWGSGPTTCRAYSRATPPS